MGYLWQIVQQHLDEYGVREAALARRMGTSAQTLNSWKKRGVRQLPSVKLLAALSRETRTTYTQVLTAALLDAKYLPDPTAAHDSADWRDYDLAADRGPRQPGFDQQ